MCVCVLQVSYQDTVLDFGAPFRRVTMNDLVKETTGEGGWSGMSALTQHPQ